MNFDLLNTLIILAGVTAGVLFIQNYGKSLVSIAITGRLLLDRAYTKRSYAFVSGNHGFRMHTAYHQISSQDQHTFQFPAENQVHNSISLLFKSLAAQLLQRLVVFAALPMFFGLVYGGLVYVMAALFITLFFWTVWQCIQMEGSGKAELFRQKILLYHAFLITGIRLDYPTLQQLPAGFTMPALSSGITIQLPTIANAGNSLRKQLSLKSFRKNIKKFHLWTMWWSVDIGISTFLVVHYWIQSALQDSPVEIILFTLGICMVVQLFFVPMWAVIRLSQKLLHNQRQTIIK
jgi:hypothetical protein